jgi:hypothetical protein
MAWLHPLKTSSLEQLFYIFITQFSAVAIAIIRRKNNQNSRANWLARISARLSTAAADTNITAANVTSNLQLVT